MGMDTAVVRRFEAGASMSAQGGTYQRHQCGGLRVSATQRAPPTLCARRRQEQLWDAPRGTRGGGTATTEGETLGRVQMAWSSATITSLSAGILSSPATASAGAMRIWPWGALGAAKDTWHEEGAERSRMPVPVWACAGVRLWCAKGKPIWCRGAQGSWALHSTRLTRVRGRDLLFCRLSSAGDLGLDGRKVHISLADDEHLHA